MAAVDPLGEIRKAIVAIGKLPREQSPSDPQPPYDGADVDFEVEGTGFLYGHTPIEFVERTSEPDRETGTVRYWSHIWIVTCKHCIPESGLVAVRVNMKNGRTRIFAFPSERWTRHPTEDVAITQFSTGGGLKSREDAVAAVGVLDFGYIVHEMAAHKPKIRRMGFFETTTVSMIGFPIGMMEGGRKNYPVVRSGSIAQIQGYLDGDPNHAGFLIDGSAFGGNSGGPAVVRKGTLNCEGQLLSDTILIGMVTGSAYTSAPYEDESPSEVMENADLVHVVAMEEIDATVREYFLSRKADRRP